MKHIQAKALAGTLSLLSALTFSLVLSSQSAHAVEYSVPQVRLPLMQNAPTIDGKVDLAEWAGAARMERFGRPAPLAPAEASFWVGATDKELFIAVVSETPPGGNLLHRVDVGAADADANTFLDDAIEIVVDPLRHLNQDKTGRRRIYQLATNANGAIWDQATTGKGAVPWRGEWRLGNTIVGDRWNCEIAIPWSSLSVTPEDLAYPMGLRVVRDWMQTAGFTDTTTEWSPLGGAYVNTATMPLVTFDAEAPVVQVRSLQDTPGGLAKPTLSFYNPTNAPLALNFRLTVEPRNSAPTRRNETLTVAAGETRVLSTTPPASAAEELYTDIQVTSVDGLKVFYKRNFLWRIDRPETLWALDPNVGQKIDASFAYFPSYDAMKVKVNIGTLGEKAQVRAIKLAVRGKGATRPLATMTLPPLKNDQTQLDKWKLPRLADGEYELVVALDGVTLPPRVLPFVRYSFPWQNTKLGTSDIVVAPFTPLTVKGQSVGTVLRDHAMNRLGLWNQVRAQGQPLLKSPMRLEVKVAGKVITAQGKRLRFTQTKATRVVSQASWSAGALRGKTTSQWDYDGVMKTTFTLSPTNSVVDAVTLVIPLDDAQMPLLHAVTEGLRTNYAGKTPTGTGVIWESKKAPHNSIIGSYVPYIWVGGQERGVSVFGENDRGWIASDQVSCQQLVRTANGTLELRLNLIAKPTRLTQARTITLGFQATPVKPMPANWRTWTVGARGKPQSDDAVGNRAVPKSYYQSFLGSGLYWGTVTGAADIYPRDEDFSLFQKMAQTRKTGVVDTAFAEKWIADFKNRDINAEDVRRAHTYAGFARMKEGADSVLSYTNARGGRLDTKEGQTYMDEWVVSPFMSRKVVYGQGVYYDLDPVASFRDYAMYYYKKMYDTYGDAIYWDDIFLQPNYDTIGTDAYPLPNGEIQPSLGLWNMRALVRRGMILGQEMGKKNGNMVHMTNTAIAPVLSFAATQADWEDHAGDAPFQDRFSRDFIQTESIGRQFGNVPIALTLIQGADKAANSFAWRTSAGVMLTHELKPWDAIGSFWENYDRLVAFGYGTSAVKVWNYWQKEYPAQLSGGESSSLLVTKPGSALVVVCDYKEGGNYQLKLDAKALGLTGKLKATNLETKEAVTVDADNTMRSTPKLPETFYGDATVDADNTVRFTLPKYQFALILIEQAEIR